MYHHFPISTQKSRSLIALLLVVALELCGLATGVTGQQTKLSGANSLIVLVREAASLTANKQQREDLLEAAQALGDLNLSSGAAPGVLRCPSLPAGRDGSNLTVESWSRTRDLLRRIIDNPGNESSAFQEKIGEALGLQETCEISAGSARARNENAFGLSVTTFETIQGTVSVDLPADLAAGDSISGTVLTEPKGATESDRAKNQDELSGYVVEIARNEVPAQKQTAKLTVSEGLNLLPLVLRDKNRQEVARVLLPIKPGDVSHNTGALSDPKLPNQDLRFPQLAQAGKPILINGPFDGDLTSSVVQIQGAAARVLAESPRSLIAVAPRVALGKTEIEVSKNNRVLGKGAYCSISVSLTADKLNLMRGEETSFTATVRGAEGYAGPITLQIINQTPWVVRLSGGDSQTVEFNQRQVASNGVEAAREAAALQESKTSIGTDGGIWHVKRSITGVHPGAFSINASVLQRAERWTGPIMSTDPRTKSLPTEAMPRNDLSNNDGSGSLASKPPVTPQQPKGTPTPAPKDKSPLDANGEPRAGSSQVPVNALEGRFRVTLNGFRVNNQTADDVLNRDGHGDEVTLTNVVDVIDVSGSIRVIRGSGYFTSVMGESHSRSVIQAGTATEAGGLQTGDGLPGNSAPWRLASATGLDIPPAVLFEGNIIQNTNAVLIIPSIWEWDGPDSLRRSYSDALTSARSRLISSISDMIRARPPLQLSSFLRPGAAVGIGNTVTLGRGPLGLGEVNDRPIGMGTLRDGFGFTPQALVLTYDGARYLSRTDFGRGNGIIAVRYVDDAALNGDYTLFIQIQEMPTR